jgi:hypothetical protein
MVSQGQSFAETGIALTDAIANPLPLDNRSNALIMALGNAVGPIGTPRPPMVNTLALDNNSMRTALGNAVGLVGNPCPPTAEGELYPFQTE